MRTCYGRDTAADRALSALHSPWKAAVLAVVAASMAFPLAAGVDKATSAPYDFRLDTRARPFALSSLSDVNSFAANSVTYRAGETVTAIAPDGERDELVPAAAPTAGSVSFNPTMDGLWRLENSNGSVTLVGVAWGLFGEGWSHDFSLASPFGMHTKGMGPNRSGLKRMFPAVAYSGDHWHGDAAAEASLTFVGPGGQTTSLDLAGSGSLGFKFDQQGQWKVRLAMADGTTQEADISVVSGFTITFR